MFERFTERARKVVVLAQEEARRFDHNYIGTEHFLLGLIKEDEGVAARALDSFKITLDGVRDQVESIVGYGEEGTGGQAPFTPRSKKVMESALRESLYLGNNYIGTEHMLLGLLGEVQRGEGVAALALSNLDIDPNEVRREVVRMLGGERVGGPAHSHFDQLYRARVTKIQLEARFGLSEEERMRPQSLQLDIEYSHAELDPESLGKDPHRVAEEAASLLEGQPFGSLYEGVELVGHYLLMRVPETGEATVTLGGSQKPSGRDVSMVSVSATFHR